MGTVLPSSTKGAKRWQVVVRDRVRLGGKEFWGHCIWDDRLIVISRAAWRKGVERSVFVHEMIHKVFPWMDEDYVELMEGFIDETLDQESGRHNRARVISRCVRRFCPYLRPAVIRMAGEELDEAMEVMGME